MQNMGSGSISRKSPFETNNFFINKTISPNNKSSSKSSNLDLSNPFDMHHFQPNNSLSRLKETLLEIFIHGQFKCNKRELSHFEKTVLKSIFIKKKYIIDKNRVLDKKYFNGKAQKPPAKSNEINYKYVIPKCIKYLKKKLENKYLDQYLNTSMDKQKTINDKNYFFFLHYFGKISKNENIPIEKFFIFRNWTHRYDNNIPKTITSHLFSLWKKNPLFIENMKDYLKFHFLNEIKDLNRLKIDSLISKWSNYADRNGHENLLGYIQKSMKLKGTKLPWTIVEVINALKITLNVID